MPSVRLPGVHRQNRLEGTMAGPAKGAPSPDPTLEAAIKKRRHADVAGIVVFILTFGILALLLLVPPFVAGRGWHDLTSPESVESESVVRKHGLQFTGELKPAQTPSPEASPTLSLKAVATAETTATPADPSVFERLVTPGVLFLMRLGLVLLSAFLVAAVTQRVWVGDYAIKVGSILEVPASPIPGPIKEPDVKPALMESVESIASGLTDEPEGRRVLASIEGYFTPDAPPPPPEPAGELAGVTSPELALVGLRIELEKRLRALAELNRIEYWDRKSLGRLVRELGEREVLPQTATGPLLDLVAIGNRAAHGAEVTEDAAKWARGLGPVLLRTLDALSAS
jgi:hypothetical protein